MGIFGKIFGKSTSLKQPANNFENIAMNLAFIHHFLQMKHTDLLPSEKELLVTSGAVDMLAYLQEGTVAVKDIQNGLKASSLGICRLGPTLVEYEGGTRSCILGVENPLLNFALQIEAMIFNIDQPDMGSERIINAVLSKKKNIKRTLKSTATAADSGTYPPGLPELIDGFMTDDEFSVIRREIGIQ